MGSTRIIGQKPRPRALIIGFDETVAKQLLGLFPTARHVSAPAAVRQEEWDVLVTDQAVSGAMDHLFVVGFGCKTYGYVDEPPSQYSVWFEVTLGEESVATEFAIPQALDPELQRLVERTLVPLAQRRSSNPILTASSTYRDSAIRPSESWLTPFLLTTEPTVLAGAIRRRGGKAEAWCLPSGIRDPATWVLAALRRWHRQDRSRFPIDPGWKTDPDWMTPLESDLAEAINVLGRERAALLEVLAQQETDLRERLAQASQQAEEGRRRLLTASGDQLVAAVQTALEDLGFSVSNRDEVNPPGDRLEDLWVTAPEDNPEWIAIAEVRGYSGGAQVSDLLRLTGRFSKRFLQEQHRPPSRLWYLVNQFVGSDPRTRPPILASNPAELAEFESQAGTAMDTSQLFRLLGVVGRGRGDIEAARAVLMAGTGRLTVGAD